MSFSLWIAVPPSSSSCPWNHRRPVNDVVLQHRASIRARPLQGAARLKTKIIALVAFALGCPLAVRALDPAKSVYQFNCQNWTRQNGLPADKISSVVQSNDGFIWLGSQNGLVRFDGLEFHAVPIALPSAQGQDVRHLSKGRDGALWFSIKQGGYGRYDGKEFSGIADPRWSAGGMNSNTIFAAKDGAIWTGTVYGWGRWVQDKPQNSVYDATLGNVLSVHEDPEGEVWIGTAERGLYHWVAGKMELFPRDELKQGNIVSVVTDAESTMWIGTTQGLYRYNAKQGLQLVPLPTLGVNTLLIDRHGILWIGTSDMGLGRYQNGELSFLRKADGLGSDNVTSLLEDREGSLWLGTVDGLSQLTDLKFPIYSDKEGIVGGMAMTVAASHRGGLWIAAATGASYFDGKSAVNYRGPPDLTNLYTRRVFEARNGDVYLGDGNKTINVFSEARPPQHYPCTTWAEAFAEDAQSVLVGLGPTLCRIQDGRIQPIVDQHGNIPDLDWINNICVAKDGAIWVGTNIGLFRVKEGRFDHWSTATGLPADRIHYLLEDEDGSIWVGLPTGMLRYKDGSFKNITTADGLPDSRIYAIVPDDLGFFWIASGHGFFRVARKDLVAFADGHASRISYDSFDGLESVKFSDRTDQGYSGCKTADGRVWFPNPHGVVMIDPENYFTNREPPRVYVQKVQASGVEFKSGVGLKLKPSDRSIEFGFTALSYISPKKIRVRYQLEGFDLSWIEAGTRRSVLYNNLSPGHYTFRVQAANADGTWSTTTAEQSFNLPRPFYQRVWFYCVCCAAGTLVLIGAYRWKVRQLRHRQKKLEAANDLLEAKVSERTAELAYERDLLRTLLERSPDQIYFKDAQSRFLKSSAAQAKAFNLAGPEQLIGKTDSDFHSAEHAAQAVVEEQEIMRTGKPVIGKLEKIVSSNGETHWLLASKMPLRNNANEIIGTFGISKDVTVLKEAELKLIEVHKQLLETSRQAGMAEVATSVLHNVGNVLNSVNVSATLVSDQMRKSKLANVSKVADLLAANTGDLPDFLANDPRGQKIHPYLQALGKDLLAEQETMILELRHLRKNIEHIKEVVSMQQSFAKVSGVTEAVPVAELIEDALRINSSFLPGQEVELVRDFQAAPHGLIERHKVVQILVNLVRNAKHACEESARTDKRIIVRLTQNGGYATIAVIDNGIGIPKENLTRIFAHGFTTKKEGHGFGLHSGALAAKQMGGTLTAESTGPGEGATFVLQLPLNPSSDIDA